MDETMSRGFTKKQMGDAAEMIVAAELTLAKVPALKVPDNWPHYDVIAQPPQKKPQRISVKARTFKEGAAYVQYKASDKFDWLAIVILKTDRTNSRSIYIIPRNVADKQFSQNGSETKTANVRYMKISKVESLFARYRDNFALSRTVKSVAIRPEEQ